MATPNLMIQTSKEMNSQDFNLLRSVFTAASEGIIIVNKEGRILMANPKAANLFGYDVEEFKKLQLEDLIPNKYRKQHVSHRKGFFKYPRSRSMGANMDLLALRKDDTEFPVEVSLSSFKSDTEILTVAFIIDITERKRSENALKESKDQLKEYADTLEDRVKKRTRELEHLNLGLQSQVQERKLAETALLETQKLYSAIAKNFPNGIISVLDTDFNYVFIDGAELKARGWDAADFIGQSFFSAMTDVPDLSEHLTVLQNGEEFSREVNLFGVDYLIHAVPLYDDDNVLFQYLVVEENISKQKLAEQEILHALEKEKQLNELKSRFVSMASHEFRTPLSTILSSISLIGKYANDASEKREKHIARIKSAISNMTNILNDFLSIGKLEEGKIAYQGEWIILQELLKHVCEEMEGTLKNGQKINCKGGDIEAYIDPKLMKNVFINLLSNASKYSGENQPIDVTAKTKGKSLIIEFADRGLGIPEEEQPSIFTRFYRAANATNIQGTGLGLHIVRKYVELMKGKITFESTVNKGTTFKLNIPIHEKENSSH